MSIHGDSDPTAPYSQALRLRDVLSAVHARNQLVTIPDGKHGGFTPEERFKAYSEIHTFPGAAGLPMGQ